jgi:hypothetical protein
MNALYKNRSKINFSHEKEGYLVVNKQRDMIPVPKRNILFELMALTESDIELGNHSETMRSLFSNLKKIRIFLYIIHMSFLLRSIIQDMHSNAF